MPINNKQRAFINEYMINGHNASRAYAKAYPDSSDKACESNGARLIRNDKIRREIGKELGKLQVKAGFDREKALSLLQEAVQIARTQHNPAGITAAVRELNTLFGLHPDKGQSIAPVQLIVSRKDGPKLATG